MLLSARAPRPFHHLAALACAGTAAPEASWEALDQFLGWFSDGILLVYELLPLFPLLNKAAEVEGESRPILPLSQHGVADLVHRPRSRHVLILRGYFPIPNAVLSLAGVFCSFVYSPAAGDERRTPLAGTFVGNHITLHVCARPNPPESPRRALARPRSRFCSHYSPERLAGCL